MNARRWSLLILIVVLAIVIFESLFPSQGIKKDELISQAQLAQTNAIGTYQAQSQSQLQIAQTNAIVTFEAQIAATATMEAN